MKPNNWLAMVVAVLLAFIAAAGVGVIVYHRNDPIPLQWVTSDNSVTYDGSEFSIISFTEEAFDPDTMWFSITDGAVMGILTIEQRVVEPSSDSGGLSCSMLLRKNGNSWRTEPMIPALYDSSGSCHSNSLGEPLEVGDVNVIRVGWIVPPGTMDGAHVVMNFPGTRTTIGIKP